jgi:hypothetical protein
MNAIDRRNVLGGILCGVLATGLGVSSLSNTVEATPLALEKDLARKVDDLREKAQAVASRPPRRPLHPRRRRPPRRVCWWHRGRRVCGWR